MKNKTKSVHLQALAVLLLKQVEFDVVISYSAFSYIPKMSKTYHFTRQHV